MTQDLTIRGLLLAVAASICSGIGVATIRHGLATEIIQFIPLIAGLTIYAAGVVCGIVLIGAYPLSVVYPVTVGLSLAVLGAISSFVLGEAMTIFKLVGTSLILIGVGLLVAPTAKTDRAG